MEPIVLAKLFLQVTFEQAIVRNKNVMEAMTLANILLQEPSKQTTTIRQRLHEGNKKLANMLPKDPFKQAIV